MELRSSQFKVHRVGGLGASNVIYRILVAFFDTPLPLSELGPVHYNVFKHRNLRHPSDHPPLEYSDVFYGWPLGRTMAKRIRNYEENVLKSMTMVII